MSSFFHSLLGLRFPLLTPFLSDFMGLLLSFFLCYKNIRKRHGSDLETRKNPEKDSDPRVRSKERGDPSMRRLRAKAGF